MLKNYFKIALRKLSKHKTDSFISIFGLAIGLSCCILLVSYVRMEWSVDNFHEYFDRLYRVSRASDNPDPENRYKTIVMPTPLSAEIDSTFPGVEEVVSLAFNQLKMERDGKYYDQQVLTADPGFFKAFTFPIQFGDKESPISEPGQIVLTEETAKRLFGQKNAVGQTLSFRFQEEIYSYTVSAVTEPIPANSSIQFEMVLPFENFFDYVPADEQKTFKENWHIGFKEIWVLLKENASPEDLEENFSSIIKTQYGSFGASRNMEMGLQPFSGAYFDQEYTSAITGNSNQLYILILGGIGVIILLIAGINFISLTLSRSAARSHEIGIRKSAGAKRRQIAFQVLGEIFITCSLSFTLALIIAEVTTPFFNQVTGKYLSISLFRDPVLLSLLVSVLLTITLVTGIYPALAISGKKASELFSGRGSAPKISLFVKTLICVQFALSISFLISTFVMQDQLNYLSDKNLGFSTNNVLAISLDSQHTNTTHLADIFKQEAQRIPGIENISVTASVYTTNPEHIRIARGIGIAALHTSTTLSELQDHLRVDYVDAHYLQTMDIKLLSGHNFSANKPSELKDGIIINERFAELMGWENPVGRTIVDKPEDGWHAHLDGKKIIGLVSNYHASSMHDQIDPIVLQHMDSESYNLPGTILVEYAGENVSETINRLSVLWSSIAPGDPFQYNFLDDMVALQYESERRWKRIISLASFIAIILTCFGLFGLAALSAQRRIKEIGIRKVLGATVTNIVTLLSKDFVKLVVVGFVLAIPLAWYAMNQWLADFAYKIEIGAGIFALAGGVALLIALLTVSWQSIRAAIANPVDSLKNE